MAGSERTPRTFEQRQTTAVLRDSVPPLIALIVVEAVIGSMDLDADSNGWHLALVLLPLVPAIWLGWAQVRSVRRADEFQRYAQMEAMSVGFAVAMFIALTGSLLGGADVGSSTQFLQLTFIGGILAWVAALVVRLRR